ncbi:hypothetical protein Asd1617_05930 [Shigella dysenteriae 1617]|uniref:Uncharacterized protein n=1 Tax=Shigella dysenteriae 1617 TaxID=754093 RepID=A0A0A7A3D5_SHIDY|nr:hypothetical protein Asd1617_05930 [Shigella dysenteriae 1617]
MNYFYPDDELKKVSISNQEKVLFIPGDASN